MSKERHERVLLEDMLESIQCIQEYVSGYTYEQFADDRKTLGKDYRAQKPHHS